MLEGAPDVIVTTKRKWPDEARPSSNLMKGARRLQHLIALLHRLRLHVHFRAHLPEFLRPSAPCPACAKASADKPCSGSLSVAA